MRSCVLVLVFLLVGCAAGDDAAPSRAIDAGPNHIDAGSSDGGSTDAGSSDGGSVDAGPSDVDAGPVVSCEGFRVELLARRRAAGVSASGAVTIADVTVGELDFLTEELMPYTFALDVASVLADERRILLSGQNVEMRDVVVRYDGRVYFLLDGFITDAWDWVDWALPVPSECRREPALPPDTTEVALMGTSRSYRIDAPAGREVRIWARISGCVAEDPADLLAAFGLRLIPDRPVEAPESLATWQLIHNGSHIDPPAVLEDVPIGTGPGTLWLSRYPAGVRSTTPVPEMCNVELHVRFR